MKRGAEPYAFIIPGLGGKARVPPITAHPGGAVQAVFKCRPAQGPRSKKTTNSVTMINGEPGSVLFPRPGSPLSGSGRSCREEASGDDNADQTGAEALGAAHGVWPSPFLHRTRTRSSRKSRASSRRAHVPICRPGIQDSPSAYHRVSGELISSLTAALPRGIVKDQGLLLLIKQRHLPGSHFVC